jgi:hypothetical protein
MLNVLVYKEKERGKCECEGENMTEREATFIATLNSISCNIKKTFQYIEKAT